MRGDRPARPAGAGGLIHACLVLLLGSFVCATRAGAAEVPIDAQGLYDLSVPIDTLLSRAGKAAHADRHEEAIRNLRQAFGRQPKLRDSLAAEFGTQLTWAGRYEEALVELHAALARRPERTEVWRVRALAEAWGGHTEEALASYREILRLRPGDPGARLGEARMLSWLGRSDESLGEYEEIARQDPSSADAWLGMAQVHAWSGRPDLALAALERGRQEGNASPELARMEREIRGQWQPRVIALWDHTRDSDEFSGHSLRLEGELPVGQRGRVRGGSLRGWYDRPGETDRRDHWLLVGGEWRFSNAWFTRGLLQGQLDRPAGADYSPWNLDLAGVWTPSPRLRVDLSTVRYTPFTFEVYPDRVRAATLGLGITTHPVPAAEVIAALDRTNYSDDNRMVQARVLGRWTLRPRQPHARVEAGVIYRDSRRWTGHGIWNPDRNWVEYGRGELAAEVRRGLIADVFLEPGFGKEGTGSTDPYLAFGAGLAWLWRNLRFEGRAAHYGPYDRTAGGYRRSWQSLSVSAGL